MTSNYPKLPLLNHAPHLPSYPHHMMQAQRSSQSATEYPLGVKKVIQEHLHLQSVDHSELIYTAVSPDTYG